MTDRFEDLIGGTDGLDEVELERLRRVHGLLVEAGPPPEVSTELAAPPTPQPIRLLPRRRRPTLALLAAALALALFGTGYFVAGKRGEVDVVAKIPLASVGDGRGASATIELLPEDASGNWPLNLLVRGLPVSSGRTDSYKLWLAKGGKLTKLCGEFTVHEGLTEVQLSVPFRLRGSDWVVTRTGSEEPLLST